MKQISHFGEIMIKTLDKFHIGESGTVIKVDGERKIKRRLYEPSGSKAPCRILLLGLGIILPISMRET